MIFVFKRFLNFLFFAVIFVNFYLILIIEGLYPLPCRSNIKVAIMS